MGFLGKLKMKHRFMCKGNTNWILYSTTEIMSFNVRQVITVEWDKTCHSSVRDER